jgi:hypothetical protein
LSFSPTSVSGQAVNAGSATIDNPAGITIAKWGEGRGRGTISNGVLVATKLSVRQSSDDAAENNNVNIKIEAVATA